MTIGGRLRYRELGDRGLSRAVITFTFEVGAVVNGEYSSPGGGGRERSPLLLTSSPARRSGALIDG